MLHSYHPAKILKIWIFPLCTEEKFKILEFLLDDKNISLFLNYFYFRRINNFIDLWCLVALGGLYICVSLTSFQKNDKGWPQQPLTEKVSDISEKMDFWWSIPQKGTGIGHLGARDDQTNRISKVLDEMRLSRSLRPLRLLRPLRSLRLQRF